MGISDKIEVAKTAIEDDKMDNPIAILIKMDNVIHSMKAKKSSKNCGARSEFFVLLIKAVACFIFSFPSSTSCLLGLARSITSHLICKDFALKNRRFDGKTRDENDVHRYP